MVGSRARLDTLRATLAAQGIRPGALVGAGAAATVYEGNDQRIGSAAELQAGLRGVRRSVSATAPNSPADSREPAGSVRPAAAASR